MSAQHYRQPSLGAWSIGMLARKKRPRSTFGMFQKSELAFAKVYPPPQVSYVAIRQLREEEQRTAVRMDGRYRAALVWRQAWWFFLALRSW